jgi:hypothetical protein
MRKILEELTQYESIPFPAPEIFGINHRNSTLEEICLFVEEKLSRHKVIRVIFSKADVGKITEYREILNVAMQKFEVRHILH